MVCDAAAASGKRALTALLALARDAEQV